MDRNTIRKIFLATLLPLNIFMLAFFWWKTGLKNYVVISAISTVGWLSFMLVVLKHGYMLGRRIVVTREENSLKFYCNVGLLLFGYLLMIFFSVGLYLQETGYLARN